MRFGRQKRRISRLLLVEDEPLVAFDTEHYLIEEDFTVVATTDSVANALAILNSGEAIDLVLVDVSLIDGSGIDVARHAHSRSIPVLFVTADCPGEAMSLAAGCLTKPYPQRDLLAAINAIDAVIAGEKPRRIPPSFNLFLAAA